MNQYLIGLSLAVLLSLVNAALAQNSKSGDDKKRGIDLMPGFRSGAVVEFRSASNIQHTPKGEANDFVRAKPATIQTESGQQIRVIGVDESGNAQLEWTLQYMIVKSDQAIPGINGSLNYDSREPDSTSLLAPLFGPLINQPISFKVDAFGKAIEHAAVPSGGNEIMDSVLGGFFSPAMFEQLPFFMTAGAPKPAFRDSRWSRKTAIALPMGMGSFDLNSDYVIKKFQKKSGLATLEMTGTVTKGQMPQNNPGEPGGLMRPDSFVVHESSFGGAVQWDTELGWLMQADSQMSLNFSCETALGRMQIEQLITSVVQRTDFRMEPIPKPEESPGEKPQPTPGDPKPAPDETSQNPDDPQPKPDDPQPKPDDEEPPSNDNDF